MKKLFACLLALCLILCAGVSVAESTRITVQGVAEAAAAPDVVTITAGGLAEAATVSEAQAQLSAVINRTTEALTALGIAGEDIVTGGYYYSPSYSYAAEQPALKGYQASHSLVITCRDVTLLNDVIEVLTDCGMTEFYSLTYDVTNRNELYADVLCKAVAYARSKAELIAAAEGMTLTGVASVTEETATEYLYAEEKMRYDAKEASGFDAGIRAGNVTVTAAVTVSYDAETAD